MEPASSKIMVTRRHSGRRASVNRINERSSAGAASAALANGLLQASPLRKKKRSHHWPSAASVDEISKTWHPGGSHHHQLSGEGSGTSRAFSRQLSGPQDGPWPSPPHTWRGGPPPLHSLTRRDHDVGRKLFVQAMCASVTLPVLCYRRQLPLLPISMCRDIGHAHRMCTSAGTKAKLRLNGVDEFHDRSSCSILSNRASRLCRRSSGEESKVIAIAQNNKLVYTTI